MKFLENFKLLQVSFLGYFKRWEQNLLAYYYNFYHLKQFESNMYMAIMNHVDFLQQGGIDLWKTFRMRKFQLKTINDLVFSERVMQGTARL